MTGAPRNVVQLADGREYPYRIRLVPRGRWLRIRVCARDGLVVSAPRWARRREIAAFVIEQRDWVLARLQELAAQRRLWAASTPAVPPAIVAFPALAESWRVEYRQTAAATVTARIKTPGELLVCGPITQQEACRDALRRWTRRHARTRLLPLLEQLSAETGLRYTGLSVKGQRTRWGSCSATGNISLNYTLLFLAPELTRYVLIHELCHTEELNHSARYWRLVTRHVPDHKTLEQGLRAARGLIPGVGGSEPAAAFDY